MKKADLICTVCATRGAAKTRNSGSFAIELLLWLAGLGAWLALHWIFLILPIGYTLYRVARGTARSCGACGAQALVPVDSPVGRKLIE